MVIKNSADYLRIMNTLLPQIVDNTSKRLVEKLQEIIEEEVYSRDYPQGDWFGRTYEFKNSWTSSVPSMIGGWWQSTIGNQDYNFAWNNDDNEWSHGNRWSPLTNDALNEIINQRQGGSDFGFPALQRNYWTPFLIWCDTHLEGIIQEESRKVGLPLDLVMGSILGG